MLLRSIKHRQIFTAVKRTTGGAVKWMCCPHLLISLFSLTSYRACQLNDAPATSEGGRSHSKASVSCTLGMPLYWQKWSKPLRISGRLKWCTVPVCQLCGYCTEHPNILDRVESQPKPCLDLQSQHPLVKWPLPLIWSSKCIWTHKRSSTFQQMSNTPFMGSGMSLFH